MVPLSWKPGQAVEFRHDSAYPQSRCAVRSVRRDSNGTHVDMAQPCWSYGRLLGQVSKWRRQADALGRFRIKLLLLNKSTLLVNLRLLDKLKDVMYKCMRTLYIAIILIHLTLFGAQMDFPSAVINGNMTLATGEWQHRDDVGLMYRPRTEEERAALLSGALVARVPFATTLLDIDVR